LAVFLIVTALLSREVDDLKNHTTIRTSHTYGQRNELPAKPKAAMTQRFPRTSSAALANLTFDPPGNQQTTRMLIFAQELFAREVA
jgi:hypothetical protein